MSKPFLHQKMGMLMKFFFSWLSRIVLLLMALFIFLALWSYCPVDRCWDVANSCPIQNIGGIKGAWIAGLLFQWLGIGAWIVPFWMLYSTHFFGAFSLPPYFFMALFFVSAILMPPGFVSRYPGALSSIFWHMGLGSGYRFMLLIFLCIWFTRRFLKRQWQSKTLVRKKKNPIIKNKNMASSLTSAYVLPPTSLLKEPFISRSHHKKDIYIDQLKSVLKDFGIKGHFMGAHPGPIVTLYEFEPSAGVRSARIISLSDDIARSMSALSVRVAVIPGKNLLGIELSNQKKDTVYLRSLLQSDAYQKVSRALPMVLGKDIGGHPVICDLTKMPHLLVAGTTGSGKSVGINAMILSLLYKLSPDQCKMIMIDPKMLELSVYQDIPHLLTPVITEPKKAITALKWVVQEMENRYRLMSGLGVRNIMGYNEKIRSGKGMPDLTGRDQKKSPTEHAKELPFIVVIVDEFADLMLVAGKEIEVLVQRLAQMARASGIHIIMATQRPSVDVITGTIKANFPTRISFQVTSKIDSRTILGEQGAEHLLGQGDMLYMASGGRVTRVHGPFVSDDEIQNITSFLKERGQPNYVDMLDCDFDLFAEKGSVSGGQQDDLYDQALEIVRRDRKTSISYLQRQMKIGYNRAAGLIEMMEKKGVLSPANHLGKREILS